MLLSTRRRVFEAAFVVMLLNILSKILGLTREQIFAMFFGATGQLDAKVAAERITSAITVLSGPVSTTFLPVLAGYAARGDSEGAKRITSSIVSLSMVLVLAMAALVIIPAPHVVRLLSPGFGEDTLASATLLTRVLLPAMVFPLLSAFGKSVLNTYGSFGIPAFAPSLQNMVIIAAASLFGPVMGVRSLAIGFPLAYLAAFALHIPAWKRSPAWPSFSVRWDESTKKVIFMAVPIILGSICGQLYILANLNLASRLPEGSVAALSLADRLRQFPLGFFAVAVTTVLFPTLSGMWAKGDKEGFRAATVNGIRFVEFVCIPAAVGLMVLAEPIVRLVYQRGAFTPQHTALTAAALTAYAPAIAGMAAQSVTTFVFYSSQETRVPVALSVGTALLNIILDALLSRPLGLVGLALAHSISVTAGSLVGLYLLKRMLSGLALGPLAGSVLRALASSVIMGAGAVLVSRYTGFAAGSGSLVRDALAGGISIAVSGVIYVLASHVFRSEEISMVFGLVKQRLGARFGRDRSES
ncbi:MAG: murein biosynthesis integral membrane protein MurJ [Bacillota bacterium]|jgi:putative peptidoglycan lipid II flippase